jgi:hypothetical protein
MKILSEFYFTNQLLQSDFNCENFYVNVKFEKKIYKINLIFLNFGPFDTLEKFCFPLWLSAILEKMNFAKIIIPKWLKSKWLDKKVSMEIDRENLQTVPRIYIEMIYIVFKNDLDFLKIDFNQILLSEELFAIRVNKITMALIDIKIPIRALKLKNIGEVELVNFREVFQIQLKVVNYTYSN